MSNKIDKPMMTSEQLVAKMRDEKGVTFKYTSEEKAKTYLTDINNYLRTAAYREERDIFLSLVGQCQGSEFEDESELKIKENT